MNWAETGLGRYYFDRWRYNHKVRDGLMFESGDRVRCIDPVPALGLQGGEIYTVDSVYCDVDGPVGIFVKGNGVGFLFSRFILVSKAPKLFVLDAIDQ